jgi:urease accessory protein UreH
MLMENEQTQPCCEAVIEAAASSLQPRLTRLYSVYPIRLFPIMQKNRWLCLVAAGFGGGLVQGDKVSFRLEVGERCTACFKTQGSTKVFKTVPTTTASNSKAKTKVSSKTCMQTLNCHLRADSFLVYVPDVVTCFDDSRFRQCNSLQLHRTASLLYVDWFSSGRLVSYLLF